MVGLGLCYTFQVDYAHSLCQILMVICCFLLCLSVGIAGPVSLGPDSSSYKPMGMDFTEEMSGYWTSGSLPYEVAYEAGERAGRGLSFALHFSVLDQPQADP